MSGSEDEVLFHSARSRHRRERRKISFILYESFYEPFFFLGDPSNLETLEKEARGHLETGANTSTNVYPSTRRRFLADGLCPCD